MPWFKSVKVLLYLVCIPQKWIQAGLMLILQVFKVNAIINITNFYNITGFANICLGDKYSDEVAILTPELISDITGNDISQLSRLQILDLNLRGRAKGEYYISG